jgi:hypothetical protein
MGNACSALGGAGQCDAVRRPRGLNRVTYSFTWTPTSVVCEIATQSGGDNTRLLHRREKARMQRLVLVALLLLSALPAWAVDDANRQEKEALLQTAKRRMIEACTETQVNAARCDALVNFYRALREDEH